MRLFIFGLLFVCFPLVSFLLPVCGHVSLRGGRGLCQQPRFACRLSFAASPLVGCRLHRQSYVLLGQRQAELQPFSVPPCQIFRRLSVAPRGVAHRPQSVSSMQYQIPSSTCSCSFAWCGRRLPPPPWTHPPHGGAGAPLHFAWAWAACRLRSPSTVDTATVLPVSLSSQPQLPPYQPWVQQRSRAAAPPVLNTSSARAQELPRVQFGVLGRRVTWHQFPDHMPTRLTSAAGCYLYYAAY